MRMKDMLASAHGSLSTSMFSRPELDAESMDRTPTIQATDTAWRDPSRLPIEQRREISADRFWAAAAEGFVSQTDESVYIEPHSHNSQFAVLPVSTRNWLRLLPSSSSLRRRRILIRQ